MTLTSDEPENSPISTIVTPDPVEAGAEYRLFVGPPQNYDIACALQFNILTMLGLREQHYLLDIGCGSLRAGRLFIPYLLPGRYHGIEPVQILIDEGVRHELGEDILQVKQPVFSNDEDFTLTTFNRTFDYLLAQSIFSHASAKQIRRCLAEARNVMTPESIFVATYFPGQESYPGDEWMYPYGVSYRPDDLAAMAAENGLQCLPTTWPHPHDQAWVVFLDPAFERELPTQRWYDR